MNAPRTLQTGSLPPAVSPNLQDLIALEPAARALRLRPPFRALAEQSGPHQSRFRGRGLEFSELREYQIGDDLRDVDWRSTARTGKAHIRCYQAERERPVWLLVDQRSDMQFGSQRCFKSVAAARTAALLGWCALRGGDRVGGLVLTDNGCFEHRPRRARRSLLGLFGDLCEQRTAPPTGAAVSLTYALQRSAALVHHGGLVFVLSDLHDLDRSALPVCQTLLARNDVIAIRVSDPMEHELPPPGWYTYALASGRQRVHTGNRQLAADFNARVSARETQLSQILSTLRLPHMQMRTSDDPVEILQRNLGRNRA